MGRLGIPIAALFILSAFVSGRAIARQADAGSVIKIGILSTTAGGPFVVPGQDGVRGVKMAFNEVHNTIAGHHIQLIVEGTDANVGPARDKVRKLVEQDGVNIVIGPLSGDEGLYAVKPYAKQHPNITFLNGTSAAEDTTLRNPAKNFFRFSTDGVQWMAGLGTYAHNVLRYNRMALVAEDYSFPYSQVAGFMLEYCKAGGHMVEKNWVPLGTHDFSSTVTKIPTNIDAIYVALGGADAINFLKAYTSFGGKAPIVGGSITVDPTVLATKGTLQNRLIGTAATEPFYSNNPSPAWKRFVNEYVHTPGNLGTPGLFVTGYYTEAEALIKALQAVHGDLSNGQKALMHALSIETVQSPTGTVHLDRNRNGIADMFLTKVVKASNGTLSNQLIKIVHSVNQTLGIPRQQFLKYGEFGRDNPSCP